MPMNPRLLRPTASGFNPRQISGLALWLDAADSATLYQTDAGPVTAVSAPTDISDCALWLDASDASSVTLNSGNVSQWTDKSGNGRHFTQPTAAAQPLYATGAMNGRNVVRADGTNHWMSQTLGTSINTPSITVITAMRYVTWQSGVAKYPGLFDTDLLAFERDGMRFTQYNNQEDFVIGDADSAQQIPVSTAQTLVPRIVALSADATSRLATVRADGVLSASATILAANYPTAFATGTRGPFVLFAEFWNVADRRANAEIAEFIVFNRALTGAEQARIESYLAAKWGISNVHAPATSASQPVGYWGDKSGNGRHATQATAAARPVVAASALNGRSNLTFTAEGLIGTFSPAISSTEYTFAAVVQTTTSTANNQRVFATAAATGFDFASGRVIPCLNNGQVSGSLAAYSSTAIGPVNGFGTHGIFTGVLGGGTVTNGINGATTTPVSATMTTATARFAVGEAAHHDGTARFTGGLAEILYFSRALTTSERQRIERYLAAKWGITLAPQVSNADAQDWVNRVYANGGTVSASTATAVNSFCDAIDAAGIRDRFFRLSLVCGTGLNAALVPLYRGPSRTGTQYGNTTDTNNGPFVSGDYVETGASGGLTSNGTSKYLNTGFKADTLGQTDRHLSMVGVTTGATTSKYFLGMDNFGCGSNAFWGILTASPTPTQYMIRAQASSSNSTAFSAAGGYVVVSGNGSAAAYADGVAAVTGLAGAYTAPNLDIYTHALNRCGTSVDYTAARLRSYSIGAAMTAGQVTSFYNALLAFNTALSRA